MKINFIASGKFHYGNYVRYIDEIGYLEKIYFSHRISETFGLSHSKFCNLYLKEYFLRASLKLGSGNLVPSAISLSHWIWACQLSANYKSADINVFLLHGANVDIITNLTKSGQVNVGEAVNMHPTALQSLLARESDALTLPCPIVHNIKKICAEVAQVDYLLCPSVGVAESYIQYGFNPARVIIIPYGVANVFTPKSRTRSARNRVVCVGQINIRKGQHLLLQAMRLAREKLSRKVSLTLIGAADRKYLNYLRTIDIEFTHIPSVPYSRMLEEMQNYDCLVLPSVEDGFGLVVTEALSIGIPVVVSKYAGASTIVRPDVDGIIVDPFDEQGFATALERITNWERSPGDSFSPRSWRDYASELICALLPLKQN